MAGTIQDNVDYRLLNNLSSLVICSRCLQRGKVTPVPQVIRPERKITNVCVHCRADCAPDSLRRIGKLLPFRRK